MRLPSRKTKTKKIIRNKRSRCQKFYTSKKERPQDDEARMYTFLRELGAQVDGSNVPAWEPTHICLREIGKKKKPLVSPLENVLRCHAKCPENAEKLYDQAQVRIPH